MPSVASSPALGSPNRKGLNHVSNEVTPDRLQFTLTITYHYLFPILTMGLALFIAYFKTVSFLGRPDRAWACCERRWRSAPPPKLRLGSG